MFAESVHCQLNAKANISMRQQRKQMRS